MGVSTQEIYHYGRLGESQLRVIPVEVPILKAAANWTVMQSYPNVSSLGISCTFPADGVYALKFENDKPENASISLSVTRNWEETKRETTFTSGPLIPSVFSYVGLPLLLGGASVIIYQKKIRETVMTSKKAG